MDSEAPEASTQDISQANQMINGVGRLSTLDAREAAWEISREFAHRDRQMASLSGETDIVPARVRPKNILAMLDLLGASLDLATATMDMTATDPNRISYSVIFKNDADIILQPFEITVPQAYYYHQAPSTMFPGESCSCMFRIHSSSVANDHLLHFRFAVISTDQTRVNGVRPEFVQTLNLRVSLLRATQGLIRRPTVNELHSVTINDTQLRPQVRTFENTSTNGLQYISFSGSRANSTLPSFGVAVVQSAVATAHNQASGNVVVFTPLHTQV